MIEMKGKHIIQSFQKKWQLQQLAVLFLLSVAFTFFTTVLLHQLFFISFWWSIAVFFLSIALLLSITKSWKIKEADVAVYLNQNFPQLEESSTLLLSDERSFSFLQKLQVLKVNETLQSLPVLHPVRKRLQIAGTIFLFSVLLSIVVFNISFHKNSIEKNIILAPLKEKILPQVASVIVKITPPSYTNHTVKEQQQFNIIAEEGANITWQIHTNIPVEKMAIIINDSVTVYLKPDTEKKTWLYQNTFNHSGFYQLKINDIRSELYKLEMLKDLPPVITVQTPKPNTVIDFGQPKKVITTVLLNDDYGIRNAFITATTASGNGESVKFKEHKIAFANAFTTQQLQYQLQQTINLVQLGMEPGDELYFYVEATDNHNQQIRSDIYKVTIADTAQLMNIDGFANAVNVKPDYFRSERQIIIDAEQLLRDKDTVSIENFNNRSNNLGIDQKLLRLRYGKYLGEENESGGEPKDIESLDATEFGDATKLIDAFTDKHDNSEDATYLDPETKKQLKAVLNEMWGAELKLRLFKPQEALPFAYKALRLLKELQQKSRAYVAKTSYKTPTPKTEKRLTADLSKIIPPTTEKQFIADTKSTDIIRNAITVLEQLKVGETLNIFSIEILEQAAQQLSSKAATEPSSYLFSFNALQKVLQSVTAINKIYPIQIDAGIAEYGLQKMLPLPNTLPQRQNTFSNRNLSQQYFNNLNRQY